MRGIFYTKGKPIRIAKKKTFFVLKKKKWETQRESKWNLIERKMKYNTQRQL